MKYPAILVLVAMLAGCSGGGSIGSIGSLNPFGSLGRGNTEVTSLAPYRGYPVTVDTRPLVSRVQSVRSETTSSGRIISATALVPTGGYFAADLVPINGPDPSILTLEFRARPPATVVSSGPDQLTAGYYLSAAQARAFRRILVIGAGNSVTIRR